MYEDLKDKVAVVTGAARPNGLGQGIAKRLAAEGCRLAICDVAREHPDGAQYRRGTWDELLERQKEIETVGRTCLPVKCDVTLDNEVAAMFRAVKEMFQRVDILVNCVGVGPPKSLGPLIEIDPSAWDEGIAVNLKGTHLCSQAAAKIMIEQGRGGKIVNISSQAGKVPVKGLGVYCTAKAGLLHYSRVLALELAPHRINVNAVLPGTILTDQLRETFGREAEKRGRSFEEYMEAGPKIPLGRYQTPADVAAAVAWLVSAESDYITGDCLLTTGGQTIV